MDFFKFFNEMDYRKLGIVLTTFSICIFCLTDCAKKGMEIQAQRNRDFFDTKDCQCNENCTKCNKKS